MRVIKEQEKMNLETIDYNNANILGISVYLTTREPSFGRDELCQKLKDGGYDESLLPTEKPITILKRAAKKALGESMRSVEKKDGTVYLQFDEFVVEDNNDGFKRKEVLPDIFFKLDSKETDLTKFECSNPSVKDKILDELPHVQDELSTANLFKTIVNILKTFTGATPLDGNYWLLPAHKDLKANVDQLLDFKTDVGDSVTLIALPVLDSQENKQNFWQLFSDEIEKRISTIEQNAEKLTEDCSEKRVKSLFMRVKNESTCIDSFIQLLQGSSSELEERINEVKQKITEKFSIDETILLEDKNSKDEDPDVEDELEEETKDTKSGDDLDDLDNLLDEDLDDLLDD